MKSPHLLPLSLILWSIPTSFIIISLITESGSVNLFADIVWSCVYKLCTLCLQCNREAVCLTNTCVWLMCKWYLGMCVARFIYTFYLYIELYSHVLLLKRFAFQLTNSIIVIFLVITNPLHVSVVLFLKVDLSWYI